MRYACPIWHYSLTSEQSNTLEAIHKIVYNTSNLKYIIFVLTSYLEVGTDFQFLMSVSKLSYVYGSFSSSHRKKWKKSSRLAQKTKHRVMVTVPYVKGLSEPFIRILKVHMISTTVKPHTTLRNVLVHLKDRMGDEGKEEVVE